MEQSGVAFEKMLATNYFFVLTYLLLLDDINELVVCDLFTDSVDREQASSACRPILRLARIDSTSSTSLAFTCGSDGD